MANPRLMAFIFKSYVLKCICLVVAQLSGYGVMAQCSENAEIQTRGKRYLSLNISALEKYETRLQHKQQALLKKLAREERRFAKALRSKDSTAFARYQTHQVSFDSIAILARMDTAQRKHIPIRGNAVIDSLKGVTAFLGKIGNDVDGSPIDFSGYNSKLAELKSGLNYREYIDNLIARRTAELKALGNGQVPGLGNIEKQVYYTKAQLKACKTIAEEPNRLETKLYEYLQGQVGFDESVASTLGDRGIPSAANGTGAMSMANLERLGYQTKRQLDASLRQNGSTNAGGVQQQLGNKITDWQDDATRLTGRANDLKAQAAEIKSKAEQTKQSMKSLATTGKPSFKINPTRCLPFWQRIEKSYDFQTNRPTADRPMLLQLGGMVGYRQSPKLVAGFGIALNSGLGANWSNIRYSFEGFGLRVYAKWELMYKISAYAGYERMYKRAVFSSHWQSETQELYSTRNTSTFSESVLVGLSKSYRISGKQSNAVQVLYDIWWKEKTSQTPFVIRYTIQ